MKFRYLNAAAGTLAVSLIAVASLAPGAASAQRIHRPRFPFGGPHRITIRAVPGLIVAGDPVVIFGRLFGRHDENRLVVLYHRALDSPFGFVPVQTTVTGVGGAYEFSRADGRVDTNRRWYVASAGAVSRIVTERVAALVTLSVTGPNGQSEPDGSVLGTGNGYVYTFAGNDSPGKPGAPVLLQRQAAAGGLNNWVTIGRGTLDASGNYSIAHSFVIPSSSGGDANVRVLVRADGENIASPSDSFSYEIEQTQNPSLTIVPGSYVIEEGSADTIAGVDAGGAGQLLTLWSHTAGEHFQAIATTVSGSSGDYSFSVSPIYSSYYRVTSSAAVAGQLDTGSSGSSGVTGPSGNTGASGTTGTTGSPARGAVLSSVAFVGVRVVLTVQTTATTINQGQSVTFSGSLTPDETGRNIYLERLNATGTGWHILASGVVEANSQYSFSKSFYEVGTETLRVAIPGSPANQGNATAPIKVTVNAIPVAALVPASG
jgi:hypothetical protein